MAQLSKNIYSSLSMSVLNIVIEAKWLNGGSGA